MSQDSYRTIINQTLKEHPNSFVNVEDIVKEIRFLTREGSSNSHYHPQAAPQITPSYEVPIRKHGSLFKVFAIINKPLKKLPFYETKLLPLATKIRAIWPTASQDQAPDFYDWIFTLPTEAFVYEAFQFTLHRAPDPESAAQWMRKLHNNETDRIIMLGSLRFSPEGMGYDADISKLYAQYFTRKVYYKLQNIPILGYFIQWVKTLICLPTLSKTICMLKEDLYNQQQAQKSMITEVERCMQYNFNSLQLNMDEKVSSYQLDALKIRIMADLQEIKERL